MRRNGSVSHGVAVAARRSVEMPARAAPTGGVPPILWTGPVFDPSGFASELRHFARALDTAGLTSRIEETRWSHLDAGLGDEEQSLLQALIQAELPPGQPYLRVWHTFAPFMRGDPGARAVIGRTMFDTDRISPDWVEGCNRMDLVWVPTEFNVETFTASGVERGKLRILPGCLDPQRYQSGDKTDLGTGRSFNFLSVLDWNIRKGWDVLLRAYAEEFRVDDDVALVLIAHSSYGKTKADIEAQVNHLLRSHLGTREAPPVFVSNGVLSEDLMVTMYHGAQAFVQPSRGEGWGRPHMEAMASGLPAIGTRRSGNLAFMNDQNSYLIDCEVAEVPESALVELPHYRGHRWAEPSVEHLRATMRQVVTDRASAAERGRQAAHDIAVGFNPAVIGDRIRELAEEAAELAPRGFSVTVPALRHDVAEPESHVPDFEEVLRTVAHGFEAHPDFVRQYYQRWVAYFRGCQKVLDIGCGRGIFLDLLADAGITGEGLDLDPVVVALALAKGLHVTQATAHEHLATSSNRYDGVFLGHIVEHFPGEQMLRLLYDCRQALNPGGVMVVLTPNFQHPQVALWNFWLDVTHHRPYPLVLLEKMFDALGLEIVDKGFAVDDRDAFVVGRVPVASNGHANGLPHENAELLLPEMPRANGAIHMPAAQPGTPPASSAPHPSTDKLPVVWEGGFFETHSLALVNRELALAALGSGELDLSIRLRQLEAIRFDPRADARLAPLLANVDRPLEAEPVLHIRHAWPPAFDRPAHGKWVMVQPWEFGALPEEWVGPMRDEVDEIWAYSNTVRQVYIDSGVPAEKVFVVPAGVNTEWFKPAAVPASLDTEKRFRFLFVGGTIWRKGIDLLLEAYSRTFRRTDDVCLVIKDMGQDSFYRGQGAGEAIARLQSDPDAPEILYLTEPVPDRDMPGLYAACQCLVHPYRGEGFGLPVAEAMACGLPVVVTQGGATDDFCTEDRAFLVPSTRRPVDIGKATVGPSWVLEVNLEALGAQMRVVYQQPGAAAEVGRRAADWVRTNLSWEAAAEKAMERMRALTAADNSSFTTPSAWPLATNRKRRLLAWPRWQRTKELESLLKAIREAGAADDPDFCVCLRLDPESDPPQEKALAALQGAARAALVGESNVEVLVVDDPISEDQWPLLGAAVQAATAIGSGRIDRRRKRFFASVGRPILATGADLADFLGAPRRPHDRA